MIEELKKKFLSHIETYDLTPSCLMGGDPEAEVILVGEYPGAQEAATGVPFSGGSGKFLWNALRSHKILKTDCYTTNVVKRQTSKSDKVPAHELSLWQEALHYELSLLPNKKLIICLGNAALNTLLNLNGITQYRGSVYFYKDVPIVVMNNPAAVLRKPETEIIFQMDVQRAVRVLNNEYKEMKINTAINPTYDAAMKYLDDLKRNKSKFSIDIEVTGMETACIGLATSKHEAICINFRDATTNRYTVEEEFNILQSFVRACDDPDTFVIAQNGNFDSYFMGFKDHATFKLNFDTLLAHHTLYPRLPHNLGFLVSQYLDFPFYKDEKDVFKEGGNINAFWDYNGKDCCTTFGIYEKLDQELKDQNLDDFFYNHVMRLQPHLSESTVTGVKVDTEIKERLSKEIGSALLQQREEVINYAREATKDNSLDVNLNSPQQLASLFYDKMNLRNATRSTDAKTRDKILQDPRTSIPAKNFLTKLNTYKEEHKFFSTYVKTNIDEDNRFRAEFKQYGVAKAPGRLSSGKTLWGSGGNAQNQPHRAYEMYLADDGCVYIYFDLGQAEARFVAWDAKIDSWIEDFERAREDGSFDAHRSLASTMFKMPYDEVPKDDWLDAQGRSLKHPNCDMATLTMTKRFISKRCRHGLNYRMHIAKLAETTGMSYAEAASNYHAYHRATPELMEWWRLVEKEIRRTRTLFNSYGRRFIALERLEDSNIMDSIIAFRPQSTIGDKTQRVWYQCHEDARWDKNKARIALNVHDALYGIATPDFAHTALSIMKKYAEEPIIVKSIVDGQVRPMIIPADCKISKPDDKGLHRMSSLSDVEVECAK